MESDAVGKIRSDSVSTRAMTSITRDGIVLKDSVEAELRGQTFYPMMGNCISIIMYVDSNL
jgi:hypothetical protein